ncbi:MAG TPA: biotin/lipoyl-binding protein, partial [Candidatus Paceibacterota bacterium]|nr:biotin/lipoyl-binding protein [Candidatus Paceibacterota bacterium]
MLTKIKNFIKRNKVLSLLVAIILIGLILFLVLRKGDNDNPRYILEKVVRSDLKTTVTATGQVESLNSVEIKPETSGTINYVAVSDGQFVKKGDLIASIDCRDQKIALENAKLSLAKLTTADTLSVMREENDLENIYENSWNDITSFVSDINNILIEMEDFYASDGFLGYNNISTVKATGREEVSLARRSFKEADKKFDDLLERYKSLTKLSNREDIFNLLEKTRDTADTLSLAIKKTETASILIINYKDGALGNTSETEIRNIVSEWLLDVNNYANTLGSDIKSIEEAEQSLSETKAGGADELDIKSAE